MVMAPTDSTSSPRDHAADANEDLARKKQRLSETSGPSPGESVVIEAYESQDLGTNMDNAIEIDDDHPASAIQLYSNDFCISNSAAPPLEQILELEGRLAQNYYIEPQSFINFSVALNQHLINTADDSHAWRQHYLDDEADFFIAVATMSFRLLVTGEIFQPEFDTDSPPLRNALRDLVSGLEELCRRIIPLLPDAIKATLSRRDSTQTAARQQTLGSLCYMNLAVRVLSSDTATLDHFEKFDHQLGLQNVLTELRYRFAEDGVISALASTIRTVSGAARELKDSWTFVSNALALFSSTVELRQTVDQFPKQAVEEVMEVFNETIVPAICGKHPRALPDGFHATVTDIGNMSLLRHARLHDRASAIALYERFVKSPTDALLPESADHDSVLDCLWRVAGESHENLALLLATSWSLQTSKSFICSDIMDVRSVGMSGLGVRMIQIYHEGRAAFHELEHPIVQYTVRFMRQNEITGYIFGPESRAGLVNQCGDIIVFLAATFNYTDAESDIIWRACSTSVEADFVKAAFGILLKLIPYLGSGHLLYIAEQYCTTPIARLGGDAVEFLQSLFKELEKKSQLTTDQAEGLAIPFTSIRILKYVDASEPSPWTDRLRHILMTEICRLNDPEFQFEDRAQIYSSCIPDIVNHSAHATTAVEILDIFLSVGVSDDEAQHILSLLPVNTAVDELCHFVETARENQSRRPAIDSIIVRLGCIVRIVALAEDQCDVDTQTRLFDYVFGVSALCNGARNAAWEKLETLAAERRVPSAAFELRKGYMSARVPTLSPDLATPKLVKYMSASLRSECATGDVVHDWTQLLCLPLWKTVVRFATTSPDDVSNVAMNVIIYMLFAFPSSGQVPRASVAQCHNQFVRDHIESICQHHHQFTQSGEQADLRAFWLSMHLLGVLLAKSRETLSTFALPKESDALTIGDMTNANGRISFIAHVYGPEVQPTIINVEAKESTKVEELLAALPVKTGAGRNRVIAGGIEITDVADKTLTEAGIRESGVILICPKYTFDLDLDKVLTSPGPVEKEIIAQYSSIEGFLNGPDQTADIAFNFLKGVRVPAESRMKVVSSEATGQELFPYDRQYRTLFSLFVLRRHIHDFSRLGVADAGFIWRGIRLLTEFVMDESRPSQPFLMLEILRGLALFLRERPEAGHSQPYFEHPSSFASRMIWLLQEAKAIPKDQYCASNNTPLRSELAAVVYYTLLQACQAEGALWDAFSSHEGASELHTQLLLDEEPQFSMRLAKPIKNLCQDSSVSKELPNFYWRVLSPSISEALSKSELSESYFDLLVDILHADLITQGNEEQIRNMTQKLTSELWTYRHTESPALLLADKGMTGLLRLLVASISILKSHKKPLELEGLPARLFRHFLFPPSDDVKHPPLAHAGTRALVYDLIRLSFTVETDYEPLVSLAFDASESSVRLAGTSFPGHSDWLRPPNSSAGLTNLGMTCYMNSLLQQFFANLQFRKFILEQPILDPQRQEILARLQSLFAHMQNGAKNVAESLPLANALNVQVGVQEDVHTFYTTLLSRLEDNMPNNEKRAELTQFFTGKSLTQVKGECGHVSSRAEPFTELSITVKNKASLQDSLDEFVQGEPLEGANKYKCMSCDHDDGRLVNAMKRTCLDQVPDSLTFCLKRFAFDNIMLEGENKVNDRFEFPPEIDMALYKRDHLEDLTATRESDIFELVGVIVHQGSLSYGHYWSYVRVPGSSYTDPDAWLYVEDTKFTRCAGGLREVQEQCFGGLTWSDGTERPDSAYVLFYQRRSHIQQANSINVLTKDMQLSHQVLPRVELSGTAASEVDNANLWQINISSLFDSRFSELVLWLLGQFPNAMESPAPSPNSTDASSDSEPSSDLSQPELDSKVGKLIASFALRILLSDPASPERLTSFVSACTGILTSRSTAAVHILNHFCEDSYGFHHLMSSKVPPKVRTEMSKLILLCISTVREHNKDEYEQTAHDVIAAHSSLLESTLDCTSWRWDEYLGFAASFARLGRRETQLVLDNAYLDWVFDILYLRYDSDSRKRHMQFFNWSKTNTADHAPLFEFLYEVLSGHVDLSQELDSLAQHNEERTETARGWCLRQDEVFRLCSSRQFQGEHRDQWTLFLSAIRYASIPDNWKDYAPGKLIGHLVSEKTVLAVRNYVETFLSTHFDLEDRELFPLLHSALHFCFNRDEHECGPLLKTLSRNLVLWDGQERRCLSFFRQAFLLAPVAVLDSVPTWAAEFLRVKHPVARQATASWLQDHIFGVEPLSDEQPAVDAARIRTTRTLVTHCTKLLISASSHGENRGRYEALLEAMENAKQYLMSLLQQIAELRRVADEDENGNGGPILRQEVQVECDEAGAVFRGLSQVLAEVREWEAAGETALPTRSVGVRRSVEVEGQGEDSGTEGEDEGSSEVGGLI